MSEPIVHLVDDDAGVRGTLARLLASGGYEVCEVRGVLDEPSAVRDA